LNILACSIRDQFGYGYLQFFVIHISAFSYNTLLVNVNDNKLK